MTIEGIVTARRLSLLRSLGFNCKKIRKMVAVLYVLLCTIKRSETPEARRTSGRCPEGSGGALAGGLDDIYESSGVLLTVTCGF